MSQRGAVWLMPLIYLGIAAAVIALLWWGVNAIETRGYDRGVAECERRAKEQREKEQKQGADASSSLENSNEKAKVVYRTITRSVDKIVDRPVYRNVCLDDDGLRIVNAALRGPSAPAGKPDAPVSGSNPARGRDGSGGAAEDR